MKLNSTHQSKCYYDYGTHWAIHAETIRYEVSGSTPEIPQLGFNPDVLNYEAFDLTQHDDYIDPNGIPVLDDTEFESAVRDANDIFEVSPDKNKY